MQGWDDTLPELALNSCISEEHQFRQRRLGSPGNTRWPRGILGLLQRLHRWWAYTGGYDEGKRCVVGAAYKVDDSTRSQIKNRDKGCTILN